MKKRKKNSSARILEEARRVLRVEAESITHLIPGLDENFTKSIQLILNCKGRVIVTAIGKSGHIGRKIASTLSSTGTPSLFMHPSEALHGDLGMITRNDIILMLSNSGESEEIVSLVTVISKIGTKIIAMTGRKSSTLSRLSDITLLVNVKQEADPNNLAPTASTTAALAYGDALAVVLLKERNFSAGDFAKLHPGGNLGRSLLEVKDIMHLGDANPVVNENQTLKEALFVVTSKGLGCASVVDNKGKLTGILTDGDIRRLFMNAADGLDKVFSRPIKEFISKKPIAIYPDTLCLEAVKLMEDNRKHRLITVLPVVDARNYPIGMIHIHDLIRRGFPFQSDTKVEE